MKMCDLLQEQADSLRAGKSYAVVTIVEADQLARTSGKMIVYEDGSISGTVGGGMWEQVARADALEQFGVGAVSALTFRSGDQVVCHVSVFVEQYAVRCGNGIATCY